MFDLLREIDASSKPSKKETLVSYVNDMIKDYLKQFTFCNNWQLTQTWHGIYLSKFKIIWRAMAIQVK